MPAVVLMREGGLILHTTIAQKSLKEGWFLISQLEKRRRKIILVMAQRDGPLLIQQYLRSHYKERCCLLGW